jgi:hypothetical protein
MLGLLFNFGLMDVGVVFCVTIPYENIPSAAY